MTDPQIGKIYNRMNNIHEDSHIDYNWEEFKRNSDISRITRNLDITRRYVDNKRDLQEYYESEDNNGTFAALHKRFPGMVVTMCGGTVPWQAEGFIGDYVFYLRARHGVLSLKIYNMLDITKTPEQIYKEDPYNGMFLGYGEMLYVNSCKLDDEFVNEPPYIHIEHLLYDYHIEFIDLL